MHWLHRIAKSVKKSTEYEGTNLIGGGDIQDLEDSKMTQLKEALEENMSVPSGSFEVGTDSVYEVLVPIFFSKYELDDLLLQASKLDNWFVRANSKTTIFNYKNIQFLKSKNDS